MSVERARVRQHLAAVLALNTRLAIGTNLSRPEKYLFKEKIFGIAKFSPIRMRQVVTSNDYFQFIDSRFSPNEAEEVSCVSCSTEPH